MMRMGLMIKKETHSTVSARHWSLSVSNWKEEHKLPPLSFMETTLLNPNFVTHHGNFIQRTPASVPSLNPSSQRWRSYF